MFEAVRAAAISTPIRRPADTGRCIWLNHLDLGGRGRLESRRRPYRMTIMKTQPQSPLFPLLPSVQILFAAFCRALFEAVRGGAAISTPIRRPADTGRCIWLNHLDLGGRGRVRGRLQSRRRPYRMTITKTQPQSPLFPLLPSVQILFAAFFLAMFEAVRAAQQYRRRFADQPIRGAAFG
jgi:hypothetical protein